MPAPVLEEQTSGDEDAPRGPTHSAEGGGEDTDCRY